MSTEESPLHTERRRQILDAALKVFSTKGFHKATNKDVAQAAGGISPGLIYWYFKDKEDLLVSLIRERVNLLEMTSHPEDLMKLPPREGLSLIGRTYLDIFSSPGNAAFFRIILGEMARSQQIGGLLYRVLVSKLFGLIDGYFKYQIEQGVFRPHDTSIMTRSFIGVFLVQMLARELLRQPEAVAATNEHILNEMVDLFVRGLEA